MKRRLLIAFVFAALVVLAAIGLLIPARSG